MQADAQRPCCSAGPRLRPPIEPAPDHMQDCLIATAGQGPFLKFALFLEFLAHRDPATRICANALGVQQFGKGTTAFRVQAMLPVAGIALRAFTTG